jgi:SM-20-related protein
MTKSIYHPLSNEQLDEFAHKHYIHIDQFFDPSFYQSLIHATQTLYQQNPTLFKKAGISRNQAHHLNQSIRDDEIIWLDAQLFPFIPPESQLHFQAFFDAISQLKQELNEAFFLGLKSFEIQLAHYHAGAQGYLPHFDAFRGEKNRVVSCVYYLNQDWKEEDGGALILPDEHQTLLPIGNRFVMFKSEEILHGVQATHRERWAVAIWFRQF